MLNRTLECSHLKHSKALVGGFSLLVPRRAQRPPPALQRERPRITLYVACAAIENSRSGRDHMWCAPVHVCIVTILHRPQAKNPPQRLTQFGLFHITSRRRKRRTRPSIRSENESVGAEILLPRFGAVIPIEAKAAGGIAPAAVGEKADLVRPHLHLTRRCSQHLPGLFPYFTCLPTLNSQPCSLSAGVAELELVRSMPRSIVGALILFSAALPLFSQQPPEDAFTRSLRDLAFQIPTGFQLVSQDRKYLKPDTHEVPRFQRMWQRGPDGIIINIVVIPDAAWRTKTSKELFDDGLKNMLSDPSLKLVSQRSYELDGSPAVSVTCFYAGGTSQRLDCFLAKPNMFMVAYLSSKPSSWDDPASKAFFQTVSLKPKK